MLNTTLPAAPASNLEIVQFSQTVEEGLLSFVLMGDFFLVNRSIVIVDANQLARWTNKGASQVGEVYLCIPSRGFQGMIEVAAIDEDRDARTGTHFTPPTPEKKQGVGQANPPESITLSLHCKDSESIHKYSNICLRFVKGFLHVHISKRAACRGHVRGHVFTCHLPSSGHSLFQ